MEENSYTPVRETGSKYQLLMELGKGGMGVVHLAMSRGPQGFTKLLVLKIMRRELLGDEELHCMFMEEARISARLAHPNIVHIYEVGEHEGCPSIAMEYLEGQPLSSLLVRAPEKMPRHLRLHVLSKALAGLHAAHELRDYDGSPLQLVHRDVSPHNIFVLFDGQVKLLDFGIAKANGSEVETRTGSPKGKIRYMSPQQLMRDKLDRRADVFSVGVLLWEALAERRMWADREEGEVTRALLNGQIPPLPDDLDIPEGLRAMCARALALEANDRYATAEAFQRDLERYLHTQPLPCEPEDLGAFVRAQFGELRHATKKMIDFHIKAVQSGTMMTPAHTPITTSHRRGLAGFPKRPRSSTLLPVPPAGGGAVEAAAGEALTRAYPELAMAALVQAERQPRPWSRRLVVAGALAGAVAFILVGVGLLRGETTRAEGRGVAAHAASPAGNAIPACGPGFKLCGQECVSIDRPDFGCGGESCQSCGVLNATARCNQHHQCDSAICYQSFDDCDGDSRNGCETDLRVDPDHCGACRRRCPALPHAQRGCGDSCTIWRCNPGFGDCNGVVTDGCEVPTTSDAANCGRCGLACAAGQKCRHGECGR